MSKTKKKFHASRSLTIWIYSKDRVCFQFRTSFENTFYINNNLLSLISRLMKSHGNLMGYVGTLKKRIQSKNSDGYGFNKVEEGGTIFTADYKGIGFYKEVIYSCRDEEECTTYLTSIDFLKYLSNDLAIKNLDIIRDGHIIASVESVKDIL